MSGVVSEGRSDGGNFFGKMPGHSVAAEGFENQGTVIVPKGTPYPPGHPLGPTAPAEDFENLGTVIVPADAPYEPVPPPWLEHIRVEPRRYGLVSTLVWAAVILPACFYAANLVSTLMILEWSFMEMVFDGPPTWETREELLFSMRNPAGELAFCLTGLILVRFLIARKHTFPEVYFDTRPVPWPKTLGYVILLAMVFVAAGFGSSLVTDATGGPSTSGWIDLRYPGPSFFLMLAFVGPWFEEVFWRGFLFTGIAHSRLGHRWAIFLTALTWAAAHLTRQSWQNVMTIFVLGLLLGWVRHREKSILLPALLHGLWNVPFVFMG